MTSFRPDQPHYGSVQTFGRPESTDEQLLAHVAADPDGIGARSLATFYDRHAPRCVALARRVTTDDQLTQDVVQEVFLAVWKQAGRYDPERASAIQLAADHDLPQGR